MHTKESDHLCRGTKPQDAAFLNELFKNIEHLRTLGGTTSARDP